MRKAIAKIKLAPGNVAWYDPLSNVYLTLTSPEAFIYDDDNISSVKNGIRHNCIILKEGNLPSLSSFSKKEIVPLIEKEEIKVNAKDIKPKEIIPLVKKEEIKTKEIQNEEVKDKGVLKGKKKAKDSINQKNSETIEKYNKKNKADKSTVLENSSNKDKKE